MKRWAIVAIAFLCLAGLLGMGPSPQTAWAASSTWTDGNSNWNNAGNWDNGVPNSSSTDVFITNGTVGTSTTVTLDINASIRDLTLASNNTLTTNLGKVLSVFGTSISNNGQIVFNGGGGTNTFLLLDNDVTLAGAGALTLNVAGGGGNTFVQQGVGGLTLTNQSTIQGAGIIGNGGLALDNAGKVNANSAGQGLLLNGSGGIINTNLLEASGTGILQISASTVNNNGGTIQANAGASVQILGSSVIQGGTLTNSGGAFFGTPTGNVAFLDGSTGAGAVTLNGTYTSDLNTDTYLRGTITNKGNIQVNGGSGTNSFLLADSNVTLQGGGTVTLATATGGGVAVIEQAVGGLTLTNVDNTIQGSGIIGNNGLTVVNQAGGTINANGTPTSVLTIQSAAVTNTGLMEATNSGILQINGVTVNNAGGRIEANGAGASVQLFGSAQIQGGTLTNNGGAFFGTPGGGVAVLDGSTASGPVTLNGTYTSDLNTNTYLAGTINNNNNIQMNGGSGTNAQLLMNSSNVTLQGGGTLTLNTATGGGNAYIAQAVGGLTLTNVNNTIQGSGIIGANGLTLTNQAGGVINANSTGGSQITSLTLQGLSGVTTNAGLMEATNSGVLNINGVVVNNAGGTITAVGGSASVVLYGNTTIQGGTLANNGGAFFGTPANYSASLDGSTGAGAVTLNGTYTSELNTNTYLAGTINNNNNIQMNGGSGTNAQLLMNSANVTLQGGGTLTLNTATGGGNAYIAQDVGGLTLTNVNNTIQGSGLIGANGLTLINQAGGVINANSTGGSQITSLTLQGLSGVTTNAGLMEATNSGVLNINGVVVNNAGGTIKANGAGAAVQLYGSAQIQGGTLTNNGGAFFGTPAGNVAYLDGMTQGPLTLNGTYTSDFNTNTILLGTINNNNSFKLNGGSGVNSILLAGNNVTLQGGGTLTLNTATGGGNAYIAQAVGGLTLTNVNNTIQGAGLIGNNGLTLVNQAGGTVLANAPGQTLLLTNLSSVTNNGTLAAKGGGTLQVNGMTLANFSGNTLTGGTYIVDGTGAPSTMILSLGTNTGGEIVNNAANIILHGPNANVSFIDLNGNQLLSALASNTASTSSLAINSGYNLTTPGDFANAGTVTVGNASTLKIGPAGTNAYTQSGGMTQGTGTINGNVTINGGTIKPGLPDPPGTLTINGNFALNDGTFLEQMAGSAAGQFGVLEVTGGSVSLGTGALLDIALLGGFDPVGDLFTILTDTGGTISGTFANAPTSGFEMDGVNWTIAYNSDSIILDAVSHTGAVPIPGSVWLLLSGLAGLGGVRRFRRS